MVYTPRPPQAREVRGAYQISGGFSASLTKTFVSHLGSERPTGKVLVFGHDQLRAALKKYNRLLDGTPIHPLTTPK